MKKLYSFYWNCGRQGCVEGIFIAEEAKVKQAIGSEVYFGEILGKHSEVYGTLEEGEIKELDVAQSTIEDLERVIGCDISGYNPLMYMEQWEVCERCDESFDPSDSLMYLTEDDYPICWGCATEEERETLKELKV